MLYQDPLFTRTGRGLKPTLYARQIYPLTREALDQFAASFDLYGGRHGLWSGRTITIGLSDDMEIALAPRLMEISREVSPSCRLRLCQTNTHLVNEMLMTRAIDLAVPGGGLSAEGISSTIIGEGNYACLFDPETFGAELNKEVYVEREHVLVSSGGFFGIVDEVLADHNLRRKIWVSTSHFAAVPYLLSGSRALATIPRHAAKRLARVTKLAYRESPFNFPNYAVTVGWRNFSRKDSLLAH